MKNQKERATRAIRDLNEVFGSEAGKRVLKGLMSEAGFFSAETPKTSEEALAVSARRALITGIIQTMKMDPDQIMKFYDEEQFE